MNTFVKRWLTGERLAILLPIGGFKLFWFATLGAAVVDLFYTDQFYNDSFVEPETVRWSVYLWVLAIAILALSSALGRQKAFEAAPTRLSHLAKGFTTVAVIASLVIGAFFALMTFMNSLSFNPDIQHNLTVRLLSVYLPILLDALVLITVVIWAFVAKRGNEDD